MDGGERRNFLRVDRLAQAVAVLADGGEAGRRGAFDLIQALSHFVEQRSEPVAHRFDMTLACRAEGVQSFETGNQVVELFAGGLACACDPVRHIARRIGDHGEIAAQLFHVFQSRRTDPCDGVDLIAVFANERLQAIGVSRQPFGRRAAEIIEIAVLIGEEFARKAELAIHRQQPLLQSLRFEREQPGRIAEPARFPHRQAHRQQPDRQDQENRDRPCGDPSDPLLRRSASQHLRAVTPGEEARPTDDGTREQDGENPAFRAVWGRFLDPFEFFDGIFVLGRKSDVRIFPPNRLVFLRFVVPYGANVVPAHSASVSRFPDP